MLNKGECTKSSPKSSDIGRLSFSPRAMNYPLKAEGGLDGTIRKLHGMLDFAVKSTLDAVAFGSSDDV